MAVKGLKHFTYVYQNSVKHIYTQMEKKERKRRRKNYYNIMQNKDNVEQKCAHKIVNI